MSGRIVWNRTAHAVWARESLYFWKITVDKSSDLQNATKDLISIFKKNNCFSYKIYIVSGGNDVVCRVWIRSALSKQRIQSDILSKFPNCFSDPIEVDNIYHHWIWPEEKNSHIDVNSRPIGSEMISRVNEQNADELYIEREALGKYCRYVDYVTDKIIEFIMFIPIKGSLRQNELEMLLKQFDEIVSSINFDRHSLYHSSTSNVMILKCSCPAEDFLIKYSLLANHSTSPRFSNSEKFHTSTCIVLNNALNQIDGNDELVLPLNGGYDPEHEEITDQRESKFLEVKASLCCDIRAHFHSESKLIKNDRLEFEVLETIVGMLNTPEIGKVVIGLLERGNKEHDEWAKQINLPAKGHYHILGLEGFDFQVTSSKGEIDEDKFEIHLRNQISSKIIPNPEDYISIDVEELEGRKIAIISIDSPESQHVVKGKDGVQRLYRRSGNRTREISLSEFISGN